MPARPQLQEELDLPPSSLPPPTEPSELGVFDLERPARLPAALERLVDALSRLEHLKRLLLDLWPREREALQ
jgi:hypothetical protein